MDGQVHTHPRQYIDSASTRLAPSLQHKLRVRLARTRLRASLDIDSVTWMNLDRPPTPTSHLAWPRNLDAYIDDATKLRVHDSDDDLRLTQTRTP